LKQPHRSLRRGRRDPLPCFWCTACFDAKPFGDLLPAPAAFARTSHLEILDGFQQRPQRRHAAQSYLRILAWVSSRTSPQPAPSRTPPAGARISLEHKRRSPAYGAD
jgi:hypothetical protein